MLRVILLLVCLMSCGASAVGKEGSPETGAQIPTPVWFAQSFLEFDQEAKLAAQTGKRMLVYFGQEGCSYCRELMQVNFSQQDIVALTRKHFVAIALDIWGDRELIWIDGRKMTEKQLAQELRVQFTPTILLMEGDKIVTRMNGYYPPHRFRAALRYAAERMERETDFASFLRTNSPAPARNTLTPQPFFAKAPYPIAQGSSTKPLMVLFEYTDCASCDALHDQGFANPGVRKELSGFDVVRLNLYGRERVLTTDGALMTESEWARKLGIVYAPTLVFFDVRRHEALRIESDKKAGHLLGAMRYVASGAHLKEPHFQRFIREHYGELEKAVRLKKPVQKPAQ
jgi:thioredoxin-related protein